MKVTTQETLYHEDHGAILKHKCGKGDSSIVPSLFFSHFFLFGPFPSFLWPLFFRPESHPDLWGNHSLHHPFPHLGQCSKNDDHHTFIFLTTQQLQLDT